MEQISEYEKKIMLGLPLPLNPLDLAEEEEQELPSRVPQRLHLHRRQAHHPRFRGGGRGHQGHRREGPQEVRCLLRS